MDAPSFKRITDAGPVPCAEKRPVATTRHGVTLIDDYVWLRAPNWQAVMRNPAELDGAIRAYLEAENAHAEDALSGTRDLQQTLFAEMKGRIKEDDSSVPDPDGPYAYFSRYREGGQHPLICRMPREGGAEEMMLDGDAMGAGTAAEDDALVYESDDPAFFVTISQLQSAQFAEISIHDHETSESWLLDLREPDARPTLVAARETGLRYNVEHHPALAGKPVLLIQTNADGAEDFKIAVAPLATPGRAHWRDLVPHRPGVFLLSFALFADWLIRLEREDGLPRIVVRALASGEEHTIAFPEEAYSLGMDAGFEFATRTLRFTYSSMTTPNEVWDYDLAARTRVLRKRQEIPSGHDPAAYVTRRLFAPTADGETVPISLIHRKDVKPDGQAPGLVYGYGAYGYAMPAAFSTSRLSLVDRGFVYAIAHIRGGTDKGWRWYRTGKLAHKRNTFADFIAATEYLVTQGFIAPGQAVAHGGSAGGMLIGAVANGRPDLYAGMIAEVPFVDVINTMLDDTLPLTPPEWQEWGNPITDPAAFHTMLSYSPYENVRAQDYPAMLVLAGLTDPRVTYWEPAKWVARLRATKTDRNLLAFRTNLDAGHAGAAGRFERLKEVALAYAFAIAAVGKA